MLFYPHTEGVFLKMVAQKASTSAGGGQNISEDWTRFGKKQILSIGKKRQRIYDEDEAIDVAVGYDDSSSDGEEGRTSAVKEKKRNVVRPPSAPMSAGAVADAVVASAPPKKKKKKKGKKERAKESTTAGNPPVAADVPKSTKENDDSTGEKNDNPQQKEGPKKDNPNTKRKRPKARSRQKNIRKDNRSASDKPSHLVLGRPEYAGRPMTKETRKKLGIFKEETSDNAASAADIAFDSGEWVGGDETKFDEAVDLDVNDVEREGNSKEEDESTKKSKPEDVGESLTKIGDCIVDCNAAKSDDANEQDVGEGIFAKSEDKKKKKRKKKRKFKNLVVG